MDEKTKKAVEAQQAYLAALKDLGDGAALPDEMITTHVALSKAIVVEEDKPVEPVAPPAPVAPPVNDMEAIVKAIQSAVAPLQEKIEKLEGIPAPLRGKTSMVAPDGAQPKPTEVSQRGVFQKALGILAKSKNGAADVGKGEYHGCDAMTAMKLILAQSQSKRTRLYIADGISLEPHEKEFFARCVNQ